MKKNTILITAALALGVPFCGCNKSGKLNERSEFKPPAGPMEFKLKWPQGERVEESVDMEMKSDLTIPGQAAPMHQDMTMAMGYDLAVLQANPDGTHEVELDFISFRMQMALAGKSMINFDSAAKPDPGKPDPVGEKLRQMVGAKIEYYLNATNGVDRIEGVNEMVDRLAADGKDQSLASLKTMFGEGFFKQVMSANLMMPQKPVEPGDSWPVEIEVPMEGVGTLMVNYTYTFQNWERHGQRMCARLNHQGTVTTKPGSAATAAGFSMDIQDGDSTGTTWFDPDLGIAIDATATQNFKMLMQVPVPSPGGKPPRMQSIKNDMQQVMSVKLVSVK